MIAKHFEHSVPADLYTSIAKLISQHPVELSTTKTWLLLSLPPDKGDDEALVNSPSVSPPPLLVIILARHPCLVAQPFDAYSTSLLDLFSRPVDAFPTFFFLKASASVPVLSHKISKKDSDNT